MGGKDNLAYRKLLIEKYGEDKIAKERHEIQEESWVLCLRINELINELVTEYNEINEFIEKKEEIVNEINLYRYMNSQIDTLYEAFFGYREIFASIKMVYNKYVVNEYTRIMDLNKLFFRDEDYYREIKTIEKDLSEIEKAISSIKGIRMSIEEDGNRLINEIEEYKERVKGIFIPQIEIHNIVIKNNAEECKKVLYCGKEIYGVINQRLVRKAHKEDKHFFIGDYSVFYEEDKKYASVKLGVVNEISKIIENFEKSVMFYVDMMPQDNGKDSKYFHIIELLESIKCNGVKDIICSEYNNNRYHIELKEGLKSLEFDIYI